MKGVAAMKSNRHGRTFKIILLMILVFCFSSIFSGAVTISLFDVQLAQSIQQAKDDPSSYKLPVIIYEANKDKDPSAFLSFDDIILIHADEFDRMPAGSFTLKKLVTYRKSVDLGLHNDIDPVIDGDRMVWVIIYECSEPYELDGVLIDIDSFTSIYDAETGNPLGGSTQTTDPKYRELIGGAAPFDAKD